MQGKCAMQSSYAGPLAAYNSLTDSHLTEYYSNPLRLRHLRRMGLITRDGRIVEESEARMAAARKEHQRHVKELLASTIVSKAIEMERKQGAEMRQKLELLAKFEIVERVRNQRRHPDGTQQFNPFHTSTPPPPPHLSTSLHTHHNKLSLSLTDFQYLSKKAKGISSHRPPSPYYKDQPSGTSTPVPRPPSSPKPRTPVSTIKKRSTARKRSSVQSDVQITLCYVGKSLHLEGSVDTCHAEVTVLQQHCGGNTVELYRRTVRPGEHFTFTSRRHLGMPFGLTLYLDGTMDSRVSTCCEFRHNCGKMLGSKSSHFRLVKLTGGKPCHRCEEAASILPQGEHGSLSKEDEYKFTVTEGVSSAERKKPPHLNREAHLDRPTRHEILTKLTSSSSSSQLQSRSEILKRPLGMHQPHVATATCQVPSSSLIEVDNVKRSSCTSGSHHSHVHHSALSKPSVETGGLSSDKTTSVKDHSDGVNFGAKLWEDEVILSPATKSSSESTIPHSEPKKFFPVTNTELHNALEVSESEDKEIPVPDLEQKLSQIDSQVRIASSELGTKMKLKSKTGTSHGSSLSGILQAEMHWGEDVIDLTPVLKPSEVDPAANGRESIETSSGMKFNSEELPENSEQVSKFASEVTKTVSNDKDSRKPLELGNEASSSPLASPETSPTSHYPDISPPGSHHLDNTLEKSHHSSLTSISTDISAGSSNEES